MREIIDNKQKCRDCKKFKTFDKFVKHKRMKYGIDIICLECNNKRSKKYLEENREKRNQYFRDYAKTPKRREDKRNDGAIRRARCKETDITPDFLVLLKEETRYCPLCGVKLVDERCDDQYNLDHVTPLNIKGPHMKSNVRYICRKCNLARPDDGSDL